MGNTSRKKQRLRRSIERFLKQKLNQSPSDFRVDFAQNELVIEGNLQIEEAEALRLASFLQDDLGLTPHSVEVQNA